MRICYVASHAHGFDGWGRYTVEVIRGIRQQGMEAVLVTADSSLAPQLSGIEQHVILPPLFERRYETLRSFSAVPALRRILKSCDIVHCTVELYAPLVALANRGMIPYVQNAHGTWAVRPLKNRTQRLIFLPAFHQVDRLLILSEFTLDWMAQLMDLPPYEILTGGVHPAEFEQSSEAELPGWVDDQPIVLTVGSIKPRKGQHIALEAVARARQQIPDIQYVVVGSSSNPSLADRLSQRAHELGISSALHLTGSIPFDELVAWYQRADVFMMLSANQGQSFEGLGLVYLEAAAAGTPSIGTLHCGAETAIRDGKTGLLVPQNDPVAAADALTRLLQDDKLREQMGRAARQYARSLSWKRLTERLAAIYGELMNEKGTAT